MLSHLLINFEMQTYYQHESKFNIILSRNSLPEQFMIFINQLERIEWLCM